MKIHLIFETGETTCAIEKGKFCEFMRVKKFGQAPVCHLFNQGLWDKDGGLIGWLQRCPECLALEKV